MASQEECMEVVRQAVSYAARQAQGWTEDEIRARAGRQASRWALRAMDTACLAGDADGVKSAARTWWEALGIRKKKGAM